MELLKPSALNSDMLNSNQNGVPLIICTDAPRVKRVIDNAGYRELKVNEKLARSLLEHPKDERPSLVEKMLKSIINNNDSIFVTDFEMLFDPRYEIDALRFFCEKARMVNIAVKWPGQFASGKLTYASPEDLDYHEFDCNAYQIRIVH